MKRISVVWWESSITDHQLYTLYALHKNPDICLSVFTLMDMPGKRLLNGWESHANILPCLHSFKGLRRLLLPIFIFNNFNSVHIFGGPSDNLLLVFILLLLAFFRKNIFVLTESFSPLPYGLLSEIPSFFGRLYVKVRYSKHYIIWRLLRNRVSGVFAISDLACRQLLSFGLPKRMIFPFCYFVPRLSQSFAATAPSNNHSLKIAFVGSLLNTKGIDIAIESFNILDFDNLPISFDIYSQDNLSSRFALSSNVNFLGSIPFGSAQSFMRNYDLILLPSRYDGWGVVINEALLSGVPVVCSDQCGASAIVHRWQCGLVYSENSPEFLSNLLKYIYNNSYLLLPIWRERVKLASQYLSPTLGALYIKDVISSNYDSSNRIMTFWYPYSTLCTLR